MKWWHVVLIVIAFQIVETLVFGAVGGIAIAANNKASSVLQ